MHAPQSVMEPIWSIVRLKDHKSDGAAGPTGKVEPRQNLNVLRSICVRMYTGAQGTCTHVCAQAAMLGAQSSSAACARRFKTVRPGNAMLNDDHT